jgi:hypothetical protein
VAQVTINHRSRSVASIRNGVIERSSLTDTMVIGWSYCAPLGFRAPLLAGACGVRSAA